MGGIYIYDMHFIRRAAAHVDMFICLTAYHGGALSETREPWESVSVYSVFGVGDR